MCRFARDESEDALAVRAGIQGSGLRRVINGKGGYIEPTGQASTDGLPPARCAAPFPDAGDVLVSEEGETGSHVRGGRACRGVESEGEEEHRLTAYGSWEAGTCSAPAAVGCALEDTNAGEPEEYSSSMRVESDSGYGRGVFLVRQGIEDSVNSPRRSIGGAGDEAGIRHGMDRRRMGGGIHHDVLYTGFYALEGLPAHPSVPRAEDAPERGEEHARWLGCCIQRNCDRARRGSR